MAGLVVWVASGLARPIPDRLGLPLTLAAAIVALLRDFGLITFPLPENRRLIPDRVFQDGRGAGALRFGFEMGTGVRTYVPSTVPYVLLIALVLLGPSFAAVGSAAVGFALGRATVPWMILAARNRVAWEGRLDWVGHTAMRAAAVSFVLISCELWLR